MGRLFKIYIKYCVIAVFAFIVIACGYVGKVKRIKDNNITANVAIGESVDAEQEKVEGLDFVEDSIVSSVEQPQSVEITDLKGNSIIMNAVMDQESGEMIAADELNAIVVEATFRNVAERNGFVDIAFEVSVPKQLQQSSWQVRFIPMFSFCGDSLFSDAIYITGEKFRQEQNNDYAKFNDYLKTFISDSAAQQKYRYSKLYKIFVSRNGNNSQAESYYRKWFLDKANKNRSNYKDAIFKKFVRDTFPTCGIRLDSVISCNSNNNESIKYYYVQTLRTNPQLRKVDLQLDGSIYTNGKKLCTLNRTKILTFYISSISWFADQTPRYIKKIITRDLLLNTMYNVDFKKGEWDVDRNYMNNAIELWKIKRNIKEVMDNEDFVMDSIIITASCSPEGMLSLNNSLSEKRANSIRKYVEKSITSYLDSLKSENWVIDANGNTQEFIPDSIFNINRIRTTNISEDWDRLKQLLLCDTIIQNKEEINRIYTISDLDERERQLSKTQYFGYVRDSLYKKIRRVKFNFKLYRKAMVKDTIHTTVLDSVYMAGVEALNQRDYKSAVTLLREYNCYNTAVAYTCMDYNISALEILKDLPQSAKRDYMLAVVYSRLGEEKKAVEYYYKSVEQDEAMRFRGNLDPEISSLIKKYGMFTNN